MLVEINLLPQKEEKNKSLLLLVIISVILLLIGGFFAYWVNRSNNIKLNTLDQQIAANEELVAYEQEKSKSEESSDSYTKLENTVKWAEEYPAKTVPVLQKLTALLPERGFIQTFNYVETGIIQVGIQFESSREAAYYLNSLQESNWVEDSKLLSVDAITSFYDKKFGESDDEIDKSKLKNETYLPRYLSQFEISLDRDVMKNEANNHSSNELGGDE